MSLPYWIENNNGIYNIWTKVSVPANGSTVLYIQKTNGYSPNGDEVFEFFDDFEGDLSKWITVNSPTILDGELLLDYNGTFRYIYADIGISSNYVIESKWKYTGGGRAIINFPFSCNSVGEGYAINFDSYTIDYCNLYHMNEWASWSIVPPNMSYTPKKDVYHKSIIKVSDNSVEIFNDGTLYGKYTISPTGTFIGINSDRGDYHTDYIDYIFIRKYAENEPTTTVEQQSETVWKITITNPNDEDLVDFQIKIDGIAVESTSESLYIDYIPLKELKYIYIMNTKTVDESGIIYDGVPAGFAIPDKQLTDEEGNIYNYFVESGRIYINVPETNPIVAKTLKTLTFNNTDYNPTSFNTSTAKWMDMIFSDVEITVGGGDGRGSVIQHSISIDLISKFISSTVVLSDGTVDKVYYDFSTEYIKIQNTVDATVNSTINGLNIISTANLTNGKVITDTKILTKTDAEILYESIKSYYSNFKGIWIRINNNEILFPIVSREKQPEINTAYQPAIDGTPQYEILGNPQNKWGFEIYADDITKIQILEQLAVNPVCEVKFDEIGNDYKQCIITSINYSRITSFKYNISIELVIL